MQDPYDILGRKGDSFIVTGIVDEIDDFVKYWESLHKEDKTVSGFKIKSVGRDLDLYHKVETQLPGVIRCMNELLQFDPRLYPDQAYDAAERVRGLFEILVGYHDLSRKTKPYIDGSILLEHPDIAGIEKTDYGFKLTHSTSTDKVKTYIKFNNRFFDEGSECYYCTIGKTVYAVTCVTDGFLNMDLLNEMLEP